MTYRQFAGTGTLLALTVIAAAAGFTMAGGDTHEHGMMGDDDAGGMVQRCKAMLAHHEEMKARVASMDAKLDTLLAEMDATRGKDKVDSAARVLHALVDEMRQTREMMAHGQNGMMTHMMEHMQKGMMGAMNEGMAGAMERCPMMQAMQSMQDESGSGSHEEHHP